MVSARVLVQYRLLSEVLVTDAALVWLGARVYTDVLVEDRSLPEVTAAEHALVRLLVGVDPNVLC